MTKRKPLHRRPLERRAEALGLRLTRRHAGIFGTTSDGVTVGTWVLHHPDWAPRNGEWVRTLAEVKAELDRREIMQDAAE